MTITAKRLAGVGVVLALVAIYYGRVSYENTTPDARKVLTKEA